MTSGELSCKKFTEATRLDGGGDGDKVAALKNSTLVNIKIEIENTAHLTEDNCNLKGSFEFPLPNAFVEAGFEFPFREENQGVRNTLQEMVENVELMDYIDKNVPEVTVSTFYMAPSSMNLTLEASLILSIYASLFYTVDDAMETNSYGGEPVNVDDIIWPLSDYWVDTLEGKPFDEITKKVLEKFENNKNAAKLSIRVLKLVKITQNLLQEHVAMYADEKKRRHFIHSARSALVAFKWYSTFCKPTEILSDEMIYIFRKNSISLLASIELSALASNVDVDDNIRADPIFQRLLRGVEIMYGIGNDLFSYSKELAKGEYDNMIMYKCRQGFTPAESLKFMIEKLLSEYKDYSIYSFKLRAMKPECENLQKFVNIMDFHVTHLIAFHGKLPRYGTTKCWFNGKFSVRVKF